MSAPRLKVGGIDLSEYLRTQPDESPATDPAGSAYYRPQFSGAPALGEGQTWVGNAVDNRTMVFPLYFSEPSLKTRAAIKAKIEEVNEILVRGTQVEFCADPAVESSSFFDLEGGTLQEEFNFYHLFNMVVGAVLTLTVRPYANTATHRLIASIPAATSAVLMFPATGITGDTYGLANLEVRVGSQVASAGRVIAWGVHPNASHRAYQAATSGLAQTGATVRGASGAIGSQYTAIPVSPTGASGISYTAYLEPVAAHVGRHRVIAIGRSALNVSIPLYAEDRFGAILGATALASQTDVTKWQIIDLGEVQVPARATGQEAIPTQYVNIYGGGASGGLINASPALHLNGIMFLPLDYSAGILRTEGAAGRPLLYSDSFARLTGNSSLLSTSPKADTGGLWSAIRGDRGFGNSVNHAPLPQTISPITLINNNEVGPNASALAALASGAMNTNLYGSLTVNLSGGTAIATVIAASAAVTFYPKSITNASTVIGGVGARLTMGPSQTLQIVSASANGATAVIASAGIASTLASGLFLGQEHKLVMQVNGPRMDVWLATGALGASPALSASAIDALLPGWPALQMNAGSNVASGTIYADGLNIQALSASALDIGAREWFRFESHPEGRVYQGNASVFQQDRLANYRGQFPKFPPVGSPAPSGPAIMVVLQGEIDNIQGLDGPNVAVTILERFRFLG
jgi:hypothetical protein